jgi:hypothetical protein
MFDAQLHLVGELVELRPSRESDFEDLYAVAADPAIWEQHPDPTRFQEDVFRAFFSEHIASGGALLVLDLRTQAAIGTSRFHGYDPDRSEIEIGWTFHGRREHCLPRHVVKRSGRLAVLPGSLPAPTRRPVDASQRQVRARSRVVNHLGHRCPVRVGGRAVEIAAAEVGRVHGSRRLATRFVRRPR